LRRRHPCAHGQAARASCLVIHLFRAFTSQAAVLNA
jgi:hypothetical protein